MTDGRRRGELWSKKIWFQCFRDTFLVWPIQHVLNYLLATQLASQQIMELNCPWLRKAPVKTFQTVLYPPVENNGKLPRIVFTEFIWIWRFVAVGSLAFSPLHLPFFIHPYSATFLFLPPPTGTRRRWIPWLWVVVTINKYEKERGKTEGGRIDGAWCLLSMLDH